MLLYNSRKEFVDVTGDTLRRVGYNSIEELQEDAIDFADLFENVPGFVHNFKNFSWIDFIIHSEHDNTKARIRCNGKVYESNFKIDTHFFTPGDESDKGFAIELSDVIVVGDDENSKERSLDDSMSIQIPEQNTEENISEPISMPDLSISAIEIPSISIPDAPEPEVIEEVPSIEPLAFDMDVMSDTPIDTMPSVESLDAITPQTKSPTTKTATKDSTLFAKLDLETSADYQYDPSIAADELGLPSDLIDEFVGDFIVQAKKFRPDLEDAINSSDFDNIQILSHKLKGVAANLRIEDALEVLTVINSNKDIPKLQDHLTYLYQIITQLEFGDEAQTSEVEDVPLADVPLDITPDFGDMSMSTDESPSIGIEDELMDIMPTLDPVSENHELDLDIMPLDIDMSESTPMEPIATQAEVEETQSEETFSFDLLEDDTQTNDLSSIDIDFDEPSISIEDEPFQSPQESSFDLGDDFDLNVDHTEAVEIEDTVEETHPLSHIDQSKFNVKEATESLDIDVQTLKSYVDDFVDQANTLKGELESALTSEDLTEVKNLATQLIGMSDSLHMNYASELLTTLQTTEDASQAIESAKELFIFIREL